MDFLRHSSRGVVLYIPRLARFLFIPQLPFLTVAAGVIQQLGETGVAMTTLVNTLSSAVPTMPLIVCRCTGDRPLHLCGGVVA